MIKVKEKYYRLLDLVRIVSCFAILFYHIGILKGGYLAVCTFFVLSGYLGVVSGFKKEKFSFKDYYLSRLKKIYLPLFVVIGLSIVAVLFLTNFNWINLKPETTSVLFGYNNFWQLNANLDYFVRNVTSPFMHFWYIAILLQFELVFPFAFIILKKIGEKTKKFIPCILLFICAVLSYLLFYKTMKDGNIMNAYYGTFNRLFSLLFGVLLGFIHTYYKPLVIKHKIISKIVFILYLIGLIVMFFLIDSNSFLFNYAMLIASLITIRLIDYGTITINKKKKVDKLISPIAKTCYEVYLVQYPVIFLLQDIKMNNYLRIFLIVIITLLVASIIHFSLNISKKVKLKKVRIALSIPIVLISFFGMYKYVIAKDYTEDMKKLESDLSNNKELIEQKQKEFLENQAKEQEEWEKFLENSENDEKELEKMVKNLRVVGVGDSIMELAVKDLYNVFPNGYFDAVVNRTDHAAYKILKDLESRGALGDVIIFNLGTNGECSASCKEEYMKIVGNRKLFWVNATNPDYASFNPNLIEFAKKHDNIYIIDWISVAKEHPEYLIYDKVHPTVRGCKVYADTIYKAIYNVYLDEYRQKKEEKIKEHEEHEKNKITFIGNDLLSSIYEDLNEKYDNKKFILDNEFTYEKLDLLINDELSNNVVLVFDKTFTLDDKQYNELLNKLGERNIYIVNSNDNKVLVKDNIHTIKFDINKYLLFDKIHISDEGKKELSKSIEDVLK